MIVIVVGLALGHRSRNLLPNNALKLTKPAKARMARSSQLISGFGGPIAALTSRTMRLVFSLPIAIAVLSPLTAVAGGTSLQVRVTAFERGKGTKARFVVESASEEVMPGCKVVQVVAQYRVWRWPWSSENTFPRDGHLQALRRLNEAFVSGANTRFGALGSGLGHDPSDGPCVFRSRALALLKEQSGAHAVYSVYKDP